MEDSKIIKSYPIHRITLDLKNGNVSVEQERLYERTNEYGETVTMQTTHAECWAEDSFGWAKFIESHPGLSGIVEAAKNAAGTVEWGAFHRMQQAARKAEEAAEL